MACSELPRRAGSLFSSWLIVRAEARGSSTKALRGDAAGAARPGQKPRERSSPRPHVDGGRTSQRRPCGLIPGSEVGSWTEPWMGPGSGAEANQPVSTKTGVGRASDVCAKCAHEPGDCSESTRRRHVEACMTGTQKACGEAQPKPSASSVPSLLGRAPAQGAQGLGSQEWARGWNPRRLEASAVRAKEAC